jgi:hypothetical protein
MPYSKELSDPAIDQMLPSFNGSISVVYQGLKILHQVLFNWRAQHVNQPLRKRQPQIEDNHLEPLPKFTVAFETPKLRDVDFSLLQGLLSI